MNLVKTQTLMQLKQILCTTFKRNEITNRIKNKSNYLKKKKLLISSSPMTIETEIKLINAFIKNMKKNKIMYQKTKTD